MTRVLIIDDHPIFRQGLRQLIDAEADLTVVGEADDADRGAEMLRRLHPDVAVVDLSLARGSGLDLVRECRSMQPNVAPLILTMHGEESTFAGAMERGAAGYVLKENTIADVLIGIRAVAAGGFYLSPSMAGFMQRRSENAQAAAVRMPRPIDCLTPTERRVLRLIGANRTTKEIAHDLCISPRTVDTHRAHICEKLELRGAQALLRFALENRSGLSG